MILITSAGGGAGHLLISHLTAQGLSVRAFVKNSAQAETARAAGATDVVIGDLRKPGDLEAAMRGATRIFHAAPTQLIDEVPVAERLIATAKQMMPGLEQIVFQSVIHPDIAALPHHAQKLRVENLLHAASGSLPPVAILRPSHYMQNILEFWDFLGAGLLPYPTSPDSVMGVVDAADIAAAAAALLTAADPQAHDGKTYDLSTVALTRHEMAATWSRVLGHPVAALRLPPEVLVAPIRAGVGAFAPALLRAVVATRGAALPHILRGLKAAPQARGFPSWPEDAQECYVQMMRYYDVHGLPAGRFEDLPVLLGREGTSYEEFARRVAKERGVAVAAT